MVAIILISFLLLFFILIGKDGCELREALVKSFLGNFFLILLSTEVLSLINQITFKGILFFWILVVTFEIIALISMIRSKKFDLSQIKSLKGILIFTRIEWLIVGLIGLICATTLLIALLSPPNNYDSMTYHMARVAEWIQHQNVKFYPTAIPRQNYSMPFAEYVVLQFQILSRSDLYANLVQWLSFIFSIVTISLITKELKFSKFTQILAGFIASTTPMAILQSSSTQNDLVLGVLCLSFAYFLLKFVKSFSVEDGIFTAISFGLALLTKGTGYIFCAAIGILLGVYKVFSLTEKEKKYKLVWSLGLIVVAGLIMNSGHYLRNYNLYGHPLSTANSRITTDNISLSNTYANLIRNAAGQLATPLPMINNMIVSAAEWTLGKNINNTDATFGAAEFSVDFRINSDYSGNLIQMILLTLSLVLLPWLIKNRKSALFFYLTAVFVAIVVFNVSIKWQPWGSRLVTPIFMLGSPLIAILIDKMIASKKLISSLIVVMFLFSVPFLLLNSIRPLVPFFEDDSFLYTNRVQKFFSNYPERLETFSTIIAPFFKGRSILYTDRRMLYFLSNFRTYYDYNRALRVIEEEKPLEVGLFLSNDDWEYPIWVFSGNHAGGGEIEFRHIAVDDISSNLQREQLAFPALVIATREFDQTINGIDYEIIFDSDSVDVLRKID